MTAGRLRSWENPTWAPAGSDPHRTVCGRGAATVRVKPSAVEVRLHTHRGLSQYPRWCSRRHCSPACPWPGRIQRRDRQADRDGHCALILLCEYRRGARKRSAARRSQRAEGREGQNQGPGTWYLWRRRRISTAGGREQIYTRLTGMGHKSLRFQPKSQKFPLRATLQSSLVTNLLFFS